MVFRKLCLALLLTGPIAAQVHAADLEADIRAIQSQFRTAMALDSQGVASYNSGNLVSACSSFEKAESAFRSAESMAQSLAKQVVIQVSLELRGIVLDAREAALNASVNQGAACRSSNETETVTRVVTTYHTYNLLSPEMQQARTRAWEELYLPLSDQKIGKDRICSHMAVTRDALRSYITMIDPRKEQIRRDSGLPENVRTNALTTLDEDRGYMQSALSSVEKNIADFRDRCAAQALELRAAAETPAPKPVTAPAPAAQVDAKTLCVQAGRDFELRNNAAALPGLLRCIELQPAASFESINAKTQLAQLYQGTGKTAELEPLLRELTTEPNASSAYFRHSATGMSNVILGGPVTGVTQAELLFASLKLKVAAQDFQGAAPILERAIRAARASSEDERAVEAEAFATRAYIRATAQRNKEAAGDLLRAYIRGSQNSIVTDYIKTFNPEQMSQLDALRKTYAEAAPQLEASKSPACKLSSDLSACAARATAAETAIKAIEAAEDQAFGAMSWDTK